MVLHILLQEYLNMTDYLRKVAEEQFPKEILDSAKFSSCLAEQAVSIPWFVSKFFLPCSHILLTIGNITN